MLNKKFEQFQSQLSQLKPYGVSWIKTADTVSDDSIFQNMFHPLENDINSYIRNYPLKPPVLARSSLAP